MIGKYEQSVFDYVVFLMPNLVSPQKNQVDSNAAKKLFEVWKDEKNKVGANVLKKPVTLSTDDVSRMENAGLVKSIGSQLELTRRGSEVLRVMILGNEKSVFEDDDKIRDFSASLAATKETGLRTATGGRTLTASMQHHKDNWWSRFEKQE